MKRPSEGNYFRNSSTKGKNSDKKLEERNNLIAAISAFSFSIACILLIQGAVNSDKNRGMSEFKKIRSELDKNGSAIIACQPNNPNHTVGIQSLIPDGYGSYAFVDCMKVEKSDKSEEFGNENFEYYGQGEEFFGVKYNCEYSKGSLDEVKADENSLLIPMKKKDDVLFLACHLTTRK